MQAESNNVGKGIIGLLVDSDVDAAQPGADPAGSVGDGGEAIVVGRHPQRCDELWPALVQIRGAATEVRLEAENVGIVAVGGPVALRDRAENLIRLLIVLASSEVRANRAGQVVISDLFEAVAPGGIAEDANQVLQTEHRLDDRAQLDALG